MHVTSQHDCDPQRRMQEFSNRVRNNQVPGYEIRPGGNGGYVSNNLFGY